MAFPEYWSLKLVALTARYLSGIKSIALRRVELVELNNNHTLYSESLLFARYLNKFLIKRLKTWFTNRGR